MTPSVVLSRPTLERNITAFHETVRATGVSVRSHVKGHRTVEVARQQLSAGAIGMTAQTTPEARQYLAAGIRDIVLARPVLDRWRWPYIVEFAAAAARVGAKTAVQVSDADTVQGLAALAVDLGIDLSVRVDVKFDHDRGIGADQAANLARLIAAERGVHLDGVTGYWGAGTVEELATWRETGRQIAATLVALAAEIRTEGVACPMVSVSGTANAIGALDVPGVTEICAGAYALYDAGMAAIGECEVTDVAVAVHATVTGIVDGRVRTDADDVLSTARQDWAPETVATRNDGTPLTPDGLQVGDPVVLLPAHICPFALNVNAYEIADEDGRWVQRWPTVLLPETCPA